MKIGVVGSGVSGLVCALLLSEDHDVTVFEANDYIGGHTHTIDVARPRGNVAVDTGFIVFNFENYPNFVKLLERLDVGWQPSSMSFSVVNRRSGIEYGFGSLNALFAQRANLVSPRFLRMLWDITRFRRQFDRLTTEVPADTELGDYLAAHGYSRAFVEDFLVPFGAAIWSADPEQLGAFPLRTFVQFFLNHGFLDTSRLLQWHVVKGGSSRYVEALLKQLPRPVLTATPVTSVKRQEDAVRVTAAGIGEQVFDHVIVATHSDRALALLDDPSEAEREILSALPYQPNATVLHTDASLLPRHRQTWSSWNYCVPQEDAGRATLTYSMNILQSLQADEQFLVTLNQAGEISADQVIGQYAYDHPVYTAAGVTAQGRHGEISGQRRTHYAGAYWGYGFHEDGVTSALRVCEHFGKGLG